MENHLMKLFDARTDFLLPHHYRAIGKWIFWLSVPAVLLITSSLMIAFDLEFAFWDEWGLYLMHLPLSIGLYLVLFSKEKNEDEFYLNLRLRSIARGVILIVVAVALLPFYSNLFGLVVGRAIVLPDIGGNMAVCTLLLVYANGAYFYNKLVATKDD